MKPALGLSVFLFKIILLASMRKLENSEDPFLKAAL
jgi:hypothetical protein